MATKQEPCQNYFNSIKVQLERACSSPPLRKNEFQFHKGTIRTFQQVKDSLPPDYFNSIKVQLEQVEVEQNAGNTEAFQFHKGTIRTFKFEIHAYLINTFQFHKGTIRT